MGTLTVLRTATELVLYSSLSCSATFFVRMFPGFYVPVSLLFIAIVLFVYFNSFNGNRLFIVILLSLLFGVLGGYWDYLDIVFKFDPQKVFSVLSVCMFVLVLGVFIGYQVIKGNSNNG